MLKLSEKNYIERDVSWMLFNRRILGEAQRTWGDGGCLLVVRKTTGTTGRTGTTGTTGALPVLSPVVVKKTSPADRTVGMYVRENGVRRNSR